MGYITSKILKKEEPEIYNKIINKVWFPHSLLFDIVTENVIHNKILENFLSKAKKRLKAVNSELGKNEKNSRE